WPGATARTRSGAKGLTRTSTSRRTASGRSESFTGSRASSSRTRAAGRATRMRTARSTSPIGLPPMRRRPSSTRPGRRPICRRSIFRIRSPANSGRERTNMSETRFDRNSVHLTACAVVAAAAGLALYAAMPRGTVAQPADRAADLARRAAVLAHEVALLEHAHAIENLQRIYGFYIEEGLWTEAASLFTDDATLEIAGRGVYEGRERILEHLRAIDDEFPQHGR